MLIAIRRRLSLNRNGLRRGSWIAEYDAGSEEVLSPYLPVERHSARAAP
jgi:hypothetical protein